MNDFINDYGLQDQNLKNIETENCFFCEIIE